MARMKRPPRIHNSSSSGSNKKISISHLLRMFGLLVMTFYAGFWAGVRFQHQHEQSLQRQAEASLSGCDCHDSSSSSNNNAAAVASKRNTGGEPWFPPELQGLAKGVARVSKAAFLERLDTGHAREHKFSPAHSHVLILYQHKNALPKNRATTTTAGKVPELSFDEATENCQNVHVVSTKPFHGLHQCLALVGQFESYEVDRYMRITVGQALNDSLPLTRVGRGVLPNGVDEYRIPTAKATEQGLAFVQRHAQHYKRNKKELKPILQRIAQNNTVVVMVSNYGQSDLLQNFVCRARSQQIDTSHILVVCTDEPTQQLAKSLGLATYFDRKFFMGVSLEEAGQYGDSVFREMMLVKVLAVQWVVSLGYHVLFQDIDIVWYEDPVPYFRTHHHAKFDVVLQDDGARSVRFAPYSGNSGVYYVKNLPKTRYLMNRMVLAADFVLSTSSHQQTLIGMLNHFASLHGLRVKTLSMDPRLPGGFEFHRNRTYMHDVLAGRIQPLLFHMAWTFNKANKILFFQQLGLWHVDDSCRSNSNHSSTKVKTNRLQQCCVAKPIVQCHYRDKPSPIPCNDSPNIDPRGKPFWD